MIKNNNFLLFNDSLVLGYYFFCNYTEKNNKIRNYAITCVFLNCCIRANELVLIDLTDIKIDERTLRIHDKGNIERIIYMDDAVIEAISEYLKARPNQ